MVPHLLHHLRQVLWILCLRSCELLLHRRKIKEIGEDVRACRIDIKCVSLQDRKSLILMRFLRWKQDLRAMNRLKRRAHYSVQTVLRPRKPAKTTLLNELHNCYKACEVPMERKMPRASVVRVSEERDDEIMQRKNAKLV